MFAPLTEGGMPEVSYGAIGYGKDKKERTHSDASILSSRGRRSQPEQSPGRAWNCHALFRGSQGQEWEIFSDIGESRIT
jgi:hypothetical protein